MDLRVSFGSLTARLTELAVVRDDGGHGLTRNAERVTQRQTMTTVHPARPSPFPITT